jgi:hypothetical protein
MSKKPQVEILRLGLTQLKEQIKLQKDELLLRLSKAECISEDEENWLDNEANLIDEEEVVSLLEKAPDYERALELLTTQQKIAVERLEKLGGIKTLSNKRKRTYHGPHSIS